MINRQDLRIRDPFVHVENGLYYLLGTTGNDSWARGSNLLLYRSQNLKSFEAVGKMVEERYLVGYQNIWAPELHWYQDAYYLIVSLWREDLGRGSMIFASGCIDGPFVPLTGEYITPKGLGCLDASLFSWKGKPYLYYSYEWTTQEGDGAVYVAELSRDLKSLKGKPQRVIDGKICGIATQIEHAGHRGYVAEAPFAVEEQGKIALYWSTFTPQGYCVARNVAEDVFAEYRFDQMIFEKDGGHCMLFTDLHGNRQLTLHQPNTSPDERMQIFPVDDMAEARIYHDRISR